MKFKRIEPKNQGEWLELRTKCLTASDIGVLLGLNPYQTMTDVEKKKESFQPIDNDYMELGRFLEPRVVTEVNRVLGTNFELFEGNAFYYSEELGLGATPDAGDGAVLLECKSTSPKNFLKWAFLPPFYYLAQLYTQMICCNRTDGYIAVLSTDLSIRENKDLHIYHLTRSDNIDSILLKELKRYKQFKKDNKKFGIDRKQSVNTMLEFMVNTRKIL